MYGGLCYRVLQKEEQRVSQMKILVLHNRRMTSKLIKYEKEFQSTDSQFVCFDHVKQSLSNHQLTQTNRNQHSNGQSLINFLGCNGSADLLVLENGKICQQNYNVLKQSFKSSRGS